MNTLFFLLIILIILLQLSHTYLRFLAFKKELSTKQIHRLWHWLIGLAMVCLVAYSSIFYACNFSVASYKSFLMLGWIPYFVIFIFLIPCHISLHIFVIGISSLWSFFLHSICSAIMVLFFRDIPYEILLNLHTLTNLLFIIALLPWERRLFSRLLPSKEIFRKQIGIYIASLPISIFIANIIMTIDGVLWHSWEERLSRFYIPVAMICCYQYVQATARRYNENKLLILNNKHLVDEKIALEEHRKLLQNNRTKILEFRQSLLSDYDQLLELIKNSDMATAKDWVKQKELDIPSPTVMAYSASPIINTAISIYHSRSHRLGIKFSHKINLPKNLKTDENDLSILISNLLENAIQASIKEPGTPEISFTLQHMEKQCVLAITNPCSSSLDLDNDGLPRSTRQGHGIGMVSLKMFLDKYKGYATYTQSDGLVKLFIYWKDEIPC